MEEAHHVDVENIEAEKTKEITNPSSEKTKLVRLPLTRIKHIMKMDPDCQLISTDAVFLVTKATELFLDYLSVESAKYMGVGKRKTVQKRDVDTAIDTIPSLCFLDGALE